MEKAAGLADRDVILGDHYEIKVAAVRIPAQASLAGFYDPASLRVKDAGNRR